MPMITLRVNGVQTLSRRLVLTGDRINAGLNRGVFRAVEDARAAFIAASPKGRSTGGDSEPLEGDASGHLSESFRTSVASGYGTARGLVWTTQPAKLKLVTEGTGLYGPKHTLIKPTVKKALYWEGALHPVRSVKGMHPNDFAERVQADTAVKAGETVMESIYAAMRGE